MFGFIPTEFADFGYLLTSPVTLALTVFQIWMLIDAIRQREWFWALWIFFGWGLGAMWYYFYVYRASSSGARGFELPGAQNRKRIKELQAQIHHLDKAHHHSQLGDIYFQQGKLDKAEACYRAAMERDSQDIDTRSHLGQCLLRQKRPGEARPLLESVVRQDPRHDYGYSLMALAETLTAMGETDAAICTWLRVTADHSYPRAKVQLAELYAAQGKSDLARNEIQEVIVESIHAPGFQRRRDRVWVRRANRLRRKLR